MIAAAEQDYQAVIERVSKAVTSARLLLVGRDSEVEAFADVYWTLTRTDPRIAAGLGAAAIIQLAKQLDDERPHR